VNKRFFIKIDTMITSIKQIIFINNFNVDKKSFIRFKKSNKNNQITSIF